MKNSPAFLHRPPSNLTLLNDPWPAPVHPAPSMQKNTRPSRPREKWRPRQDPRRDQGGSRWSFSLSSERLFPLSSAPGTRHVAYRTARDELRFLPL